MLGERFVVDRNVQAGDAADFGIAQGGDHGAQVVWLDANVAVVDHQDFVACFAHQADELGNFVVDGVAARAIEDANLALREIAHQLLKNGDRSVVFVADAKNQFVVGIVLAAVAGEIFVGFGVEAANRLQIADRRSKIKILRWTVTGLAKETPGAIKDEQIVDKRRRSQGKKKVIGNFRNNCTSRI